MAIDHHIRAGILGGTVFSTVFNRNTGDVMATVVMAALGAIVSFGVSLILRRIFSKYYK